MATFEKAKSEVRKMSDELIAQFHTETIAERGGCRIDLLMAYGEKDETTGNVINDALKQYGVRALAITKIVSLKDRTKGVGDVEIVLDGDWWGENDEPAQRAVLDHELHHIVVTDKRDALGRPKIKLRKHDIQIGWFDIIAQRHGVHSQERKQAAEIMEMHGQFYFPELLQADNGKGRIAKLEVHQVHRK